MGGIGSLIASILGIAAESSAQNSQRNLDYLNLYETKRENRQRDKLATSSHTDAYGNEIYFDPGLKAWKIKTTGQTKKALDAQQAEQIASLTEDAPRNRADAVRKDKRAISADEEFTREFNNYKYRPQKSEADYVGDATKEAVLSRRQGSDRAAANAARALIRTGNGSNIGAIFKTARDAEANDFEQTMLGGKRQGEQDFLSIEGAKDAKAQQELSFLQGISDDTTAMAPRFGNDNERLAGGEDNALANLISTIGTNQGARMSATATLADALGKTPNFAPLASALGSLGSGSSKFGLNATAKASASGVSRAATAEDRGGINGDWLQWMIDNGDANLSLG